LHRSGIDVHLDWTVDGMKMALQAGRIIVVADILRFSSAVTTAIANGFTIYPVADQAEIERRARQVGGNAGGRSGEARFSLSPLSYLNVRPKAQRKVVLWSPNGAACASLVGPRHRAYIGCLLNARALGRRLERLARQRRRGITLIAAGEQQAIDTGERILYDVKASRRVFAIEDYLGCGAIISNIRLPRSAEALTCELAYRACRDRLRELMLGSFSGRFLQQKGLTTDVLWASQVNRYKVIPVIHSGRIEDEHSLRRRKHA
jgi:2-phosphosulfolactate phosphatase